MNGDLNNKKQPRRAISNHVPILVVPDTPPSGDSSEYMSMCLEYSTSNRSQSIGPNLLPSWDIRRYLSISIRSAIFHGWHWEMIFMRERFFPQRTKIYTTC